MSTAVVRTTRTQVTIGDTVLMIIGYAEAACHMRVAGRIMPVQVVNGGTDGAPYPMAQLLNQDGTRFSFPVLMGEAGFLAVGDAARSYWADAVQHADYPHFPGALFDCVACEAQCAHPAQCSAEHPNDRCVGCATVAEFGAKGARDRWVDAPTVAVPASLPDGAVAAPAIGAEHGPATELAQVCAEIEELLQPVGMSVGTLGDGTIIG